MKAESERTGMVCLLNKSLLARGVHFLLAFGNVCPLRASSISLFQVPFGLEAKLIKKNVTELTSYEYL